MEVNIKNMKIFYQIMGEGEDLLLLHGWGADSSLMLPMQEHFSQMFRVIALDLPGFGKTDYPPESWDIYDYADFVTTFSYELNIKNPIILGHSFGGRIALLLGFQGLAKKLILVDSAGIRPKRSIHYYFRVYSYKLAKKILYLPWINQYKENLLDFWLKRNPSSDYKAAEGVMRQVFVKVVNQNLKSILPKILVSTLLIWGEKDTITPIRDGQLMEQLIPDAGLAILPNAGHYSFLDDSPRFYAIVDYFLTH